MALSNPSCDSTESGSAKCSDSPRSFTLESPMNTVTLESPMKTEASQSFLLRTDRAENTESSVLERFAHLISPRLEMKHHVPVTQKFASARARCASARARRMVLEMGAELSNLEDETCDLSNHFLVLRNSLRQGQGEEQIAG